MQLAGSPMRVVLTVDLSNYHNHLNPGAVGTTVPDKAVGIWGTQDRFVAVQFDCCSATLDILWSSLHVISEAAP